MVARENLGRILGAMPSWVIAQLESWKELLELAEKQVRQIEVQLKKAAPGKLLFGEGELPTNCWPAS